MQINPDLFSSLIISLIILTALFFVALCRLKKAFLLLNKYEEYTDDLAKLHDEQIRSISICHREQIEKILNDFQKYEMSHEGKNV